jgi:hypothetical protein
VKVEHVQMGQTGFMLFDCKWPPLVCTGGRHMVVVMRTVCLIANGHHWSAQEIGTWWW